MFPHLQGNLRRNWKGLILSIHLYNKFTVDDKCTSNRCHLLDGKKPELANSRKIKMVPEARLDEEKPPKRKTVQVNGHP